MQLQSAHQENFISGIIKTQSTVAIYLIHGIKLTGKIIAETESTIFLNSPIPQMIYKRQISTIQNLNDCSVDKSLESV